MFKEYAANAAMLITFVSISYQIFRGTGFNRDMATKFKILSGGMFGLLGIVLMYFSINLENHIMIDFRALAILLAAFTSGLVPALITSCIINIARIMFTGIWEASISSMVVMTLLAFAFSFIANLKIKTGEKWIYSILITEMAGSFAFTLLIKDAELLTYVILSYCFSISAVSFFLYFYVRYMERLTESFVKYRQQSQKDFLTGLNNVRRFNTLFNGVMDTIAQKHELLSFLYIDIDYFKKVNDAYGHQVGDAVLSQLGDILVKTCRNTDIISRNGGEEFSVILNNCSPQTAGEIAERIRKNVEAAVIQISDDSEIKTTVSIGVASYPDPINDLAQLIEKADMALYEAKRTGRNKVVAAR